VHPRLINIAVITVTTMIILLQPLQAHAANTALLELIQILRNKGSITEQEYQLLQTAVTADQQQAVIATATINETVASEAPPTLEVKTAPARWTDTIVLKGDVRLRYQNEQEQEGTGRDRGRFRYRLGITAEPSESWQVGAGLASGPADPRSTNQSLSDSFSKKPVYFDYAYAQHQLNDHLKLIAGKFKAPGYLYNVSDLLWDTDVNPEGIASNLAYQSDLGTTFVNSGLWVLEEKSRSDQDPYMAYLQMGQVLNVDRLFASFAGTWYSFEDNMAAGSFATTGTNTDFEFSGIYVLSGEIGLQDLVKDGTRFSLIADFVDNTDTNTDEDRGYLIGFKSAYQLWSFRYNYVDLDHNAWPDFLPDSDRYEGHTGIHGHEFLLEYAVMENVLLGLDYYQSEQQFTNIGQDLLQLDLNVRF